MKNVVAVAVLSLGFVGAMPAAQAAPVTVDAGSFLFSYDDSFLSGATFSVSGSEITFSNLTLQTSAVGGGLEFNGASLSFNGYDGNPYPILITPKAGYKISGLTESVIGSYAAKVAKADESVAMTSGGLVSRWVYLDGVQDLNQNTPGQLTILQPGQGGTSGQYTASGSLDFASDLSPGAYVLSSLDLIVGASAHNTGSSASSSLNTYRINVQATLVPEPESMALALAGVAILGVAGRRKKRQAA